jgi:hypothetical protein
VGHDIGTARLYRIKVRTYKFAKEAFGAQLSFLEKNKERVYEKGKIKPEGPFLIYQKPASAVNLR